MDLLRDPAVGRARVVWCHRPCDGQGLVVCCGQPSGVKRTAREHGRERMTTAKNQSDPLTSFLGTFVCTHPFCGTTNPKANRAPGKRRTQKRSLGLECTRSIQSQQKPNNSFLLAQSLSASSSSSSPSCLAFRFRSRSARFASAKDKQLTISSTKRAFGTNDRKDSSIWVVNSCAQNLFGI